MVSETDKNAFLQRVEGLRLNPNALEEVRIHLPSGMINVPNADGFRNSIQILSDLTTNDGYITPENAERGLEIFGEPFIRETRDNPGKHKTIEVLVGISERKRKVRSDVVRRNLALPSNPFLDASIKALSNAGGTPFMIYDANEIVQNAQELSAAFSWVPGGFKNYFAVKACPNPYILELVKKQGMGADCSSNPELMLSEAVGIKREDIMFTSNDTPPEEFRNAKSLGAIINLDDITHIGILEKVAGIPELMCIRYNPGERRVGNSIIGNPVEAKYGFTHEQVFEGLKILKEKGVKRFGLHTMVASNELNPEYFVETARMMFSLAKEVKERLGIRIEFVNLGGGIGTPYRPEQRMVSVSEVSEGIRKSYEEIVRPAGLDPMRIFMENGRMVTGPYGHLITKVRHVARKYKDFVGVDACMANLMRPALYGAYHHIVIMDKENAPHIYVYNVTGSLCENNDQFAINRILPEIETGDVLKIRNSGAHGYAMGFNYNGKLRCAEFLHLGNGQSKLIRRKETPEDYFATFDFQGSKFAELARRKN